VTRPLPPRGLGCEFKALYPSEHEADKAADRRSLSSETPITSYWCHEHGGWHLTSR
jgi:hypothetical protein